MYGESVQVCFICIILICWTLHGKYSARGTVLSAARLQIVEQHKERNKLKDTYGNFYDNQRRWCVIIKECFLVDLRVKLFYEF